MILLMIDGYMGLLRVPCFWARRFGWLGFVKAE